MYNYRDVFYNTVYNKYTINIQLYNYRDIFYNTIYNKYTIHIISKCTIVMIYFIIQYTINIQLIYNIPIY